MGAIPIVSDLPANHEVVDGSNGIIIPLDYKALAGAIIKILSDDLSYKAVLDQQRNILLNKFDQNKNMELMANYYRKILL